MNGMTFNRLLDRFTWNGIGLIAFLAPIAIGGVHWPVKLFLIGLSGAVLLSFVLFTFRKGYRFRLDGFALLGAFLMGLGLLQLAPLSDGMLASLSPAALEAIEKIRHLGFEVPGRITLDPAATAEWLVLAGAALSLYMITFNWSYREGNSNKFLYLVGIAGGVVAIITAVQTATGATNILGFYEPQRGIPDSSLAISTFVNENHASAYLTLSFFVLLGLWRKAQFGRSKGIIGLMAVLAFLMSIATLSRGGMLALLGGLILLAILSRWSGALKRSTTTTTSVTIFGVTVSLVVLAVFIAVFSLLLARTQKVELFPQVESEVKTQVWVRAVPLLKEFRWTGAGAGAFGAAFTPKNDFDSRQTFLHAENELLEMGIEFGVVVGILVLLLGLMVFWRRLAFAKTASYHREAICGLFALLLHNLVDYNLRIPGVILPAAIAFGSLSGAYARDYTKRRRWQFKIGSFKMVPLTSVFYLLLIGGGLWAYSHSAESVYGRIKAMESLPSKVDGDGQWPRVAQEAVKSRPLDSHVYFLLGDWLQHQGAPERAERLYEESSLLCQSCASPKIGQARLALAQGRYADALRWFEIVGTALPAHREPLFRAVYLAKIDEDTIIDVWGEHENLLIEYVNFLDMYGLWDKEERLIRASFRKLGFEAGLLSKLGFLYLRVGEYERADLIATYLMGLFPDRFEGYLIQARVFVRDGELDDGLLMFEEARARSDETSVGIALETLGLLARTRQWDRFEALASEIRSAVLDKDTYRSSFHQIVATREEMRGRLFAALAELDQAENATPLDARIALRKAKIQLKLGRIDRAAAEFRKALKIDPESREAAEGLRNLESESGRNGLL